MAFPLAAAAGLYVAGSLLSAKGSMDAANAQAEAAKDQAAAKRAQAAELLKRAKVNAERTRRQGEVLVKEQQGQFAAGGVAIGSGSTLAVLNDTFNRVEQSIEDQMYEAKYKASSLRAGANVDQSLAGDIRQAGRTQAFGSLLGAGAGAAKMFM